MNFRGDLTDNSAKKEALVITDEKAHSSNLRMESYHHCLAYMTLPRSLKGFKVIHVKSTIVPPHHLKALYHCDTRTGGASFWAESSVRSPQFLFFIHYLKKEFLDQRIQKNSQLNFEKGSTGEHMIDVCPTRT